MLKPLEDLRSMVNCFMQDTLHRSKRSAEDLENEEPAPWDRLDISAFGSIGSVRSVSYGSMEDLFG